MIHDYEKLKSNVRSGHLDAGDAGILRVLFSEVDLLRELVSDLMVKVRDAPCRDSHPGESTYHCNPERVCRTCEWRDGVDELLHDEWSMSDGLWSVPGEIERINKREEG